MRQSVKVLICCSQEVLNHKRIDGKISEDKVCYWEFKRFPLDLATYPLALADNIIFDYAIFQKPKPKLYFAVKGIVKGFFLIDGMSAGRVYFYSENWCPIKPIKIKPSQGWRYYD